jgi:sodium-dependent phosphate cotransporter
MGLSSPSFVSNHSPTPVQTTPQEAKDIETPEQGAKNQAEDTANEYDDEEAVANTSWGEVFTMCCVHSPGEWGMIVLRLLAIAFFLYWFIFALELLGTGAKVLTGCAAGGLFRDANPVAGVIIGMLVTVLLQSSSTTTSIIVSMVGSDAIPVKTAIYMVMGANIGTSVTNTIVAMGQMGDGDELERAFAGATVHDMFNFLSVAILFILELITGYLWRITDAMTKNYEPGEGDTAGGIKVIIAPILDRIIKSNKNVMKDIATGKYENCDAYYPVQCANGTVDYQHCAKEGRVGLITCSEDYGCPAFFVNGATQKMDTISGAACLILGILFLMLCLVGLVKVLKSMLLGASTRVIHKATSFNGYISMIIGCAITVAVQSSSVTTSVLTPLVGVGLVSVEQVSRVVLLVRLVRRTSSPLTQ